MVTPIMATPIMTDFIIFIPANHQPYHSLNFILILKTILTFSPSLLDSNAHEQMLVTGKTCNAKHYPTNG